MQDVEIRNVGGPRPRDGVASEATLAELLEAVKRGGSGSGSSRVAETRAMETFARSTRVASDRQGALSKAVAATEAALDTFEETLKNNSRRLSEFTESIIGNSNLLTRSLNRFNYFIDENIDRWRSLSQVGATFGNSLNDLVSTAVDGKMSIGEFSAIVLENAEVLRSLSGTVTEGSKRFANLSTQLRAGRLGKEMYSMGYTFAEINETLLNYIDISRRSMLNERLTDQQLINGTEAYVNELERLTKITGMSRKEAQAAMEQQLSDQRIRMQIAKMNPEEAARFQSNMAYLDNQVSGMGEVFRQLASMDPGDELTRMLQVFAPELAAGARDIQNMSIGELHNFIAGFGDQIDALASSMGEEQVALLYRTNSVFREMFNMASQANRLTALTEDERQRLDNELASRSRLTSTFANFEEQFRQITGDIMNSFFDTANITGGFNDALEELAKAFFELISPADGAVTSLTGSITDVIKTAFGPTGAITSSIRAFTEFLGKPETKVAFAKFVEGVKKVANGIVEFFFGAVEKNEENAKRNGGLFQRIYTTLSDVFTKYDTFTEVIVEGFKGIVNDVGEEIVSHFKLDQADNQGPWGAILETVQTKLLQWVEGTNAPPNTNSFWSRLMEAAGNRILNFFNAVASNEQLNAEAQAIQRYWDQLTTAVGDALLRMFDIDRAVTGPGKVESFWAAMTRTLNEKLFGYIETIEDADGRPRNVRRAGLIDTVINSIKNMFADQGLVDNAAAALTGLFNTVGKAFTDFWNGPTGQGMKDTIVDLFTMLIHTMEDTFVNSWLARQILDIDPAEVAKRQANRPVPEGETERDVLSSEAENFARAIRNAIDYSTTTFSAGIVGGFDVGGGDIRDLIFSLEGSQRELLEKFKPGGLESTFYGWTLTDQLVEAFSRMSRAAESGQLSQGEMNTLREIFRALPEYESGTVGFKNFGKESVVKLHGYEAVVPRDTVQGDILSDFYSYQSGRQPDVVSAFANIERKVDNALSKTPEVDGIMSNMTSLIEKITDINIPTPEIIPAKAEINQTQLVNKIDELNKTMLQVVALMSEEIQVQKRTMRGVQGMGNDLMKGIIR